MGDDYFDYRNKLAQIIIRDVIVPPFFQSINFKL